MYRKTDYSVGLALKMLIKTKHSDDQLKTV